MKTIELIEKIANAYQSGNMINYKELHSFINGLVDSNHDVFEFIKNNLALCIQSMQIDSLFCQYDNMPEYYVINIENEYIAIELSSNIDGSFDVEVVGSNNTAIEAMKSRANDWSSYRYVEVLAMYSVQSDKDDFNLATENDTDVYIWLQNEKTQGWLKNNDSIGVNVSHNYDYDDIKRFDTYQDAKEWLDNQSYLLSGNFETFICNL